MTTRQARRRATLARHEALVWIDHQQAVIAADRGEGRDSIDVLTRDASESDAEFNERAVDEVADEARVVIAGPAFARTAFERTYVAATHRPDRIVDIEPALPGRRG